MVGESNYTECVVRKAEIRCEAFLKGVLVAGVAGLIFLSLLLKDGIIQLIGFAAAIGLFILVINIWPKFHAEYEYIFVDGQIDFDVIYSGNSRKHLKTIDLDKVEEVKLYNSEASYSDRDRKIVKYVSGAKEARVYTIIIRNESKTEEILFEPDDNFLSYMKRKAPRKVQDVNRY